MGVCQWVLLLWFLLLPAPFPWYAVVLAALLPADAAIRIDGARRRRALRRGRPLLPQLLLRVPAVSGSLVDLDPAGRARLDLGNPGIHLAAVPEGRFPIALWEGGPVVPHSRRDFSGRRASEIACSIRLIDAYRLGQDAGCRCVP